ncbi:S10 family peptidase [Sporobolomyces salmoneus]|uniref:S10 family peptidase n=1 Tax=Sporobolomyces salmoneus TaxID=183962 RepID=UPI00317E1A20
MRSLLLALISSIQLVTALPTQDQLPFALPAAAPHPQQSHHSHPALPRHRVRLRGPQGLCDSSVKNYAGYLDVSEAVGEDFSRHFFSWIWESRSDPRNDPVVLWLNGGPGCSDAVGLLQELGPCRAQKHGDPIRNPYSWNNNATIIFLDQPIGVGFSYSDKDDYGVWTTEAAARDTYAFLQIFFHTFKDRFANNEFHIAGESYGGRYVPLFADYILKENEKLKTSSKDDLKPINLVSILVGNGFTDPKTQYGSYIPTVCTNSTGYGPFLDEPTCDKMRETLPRCQSLVQECYDDPASATKCSTAFQYCENSQSGPYDKTGRSPYDMEKFGEYEENEWIESWLNSEAVRKELGVDLEPHRHGGGIKKFKGCSNKVGFRFTISGDQARPSFPAVSHLVNNGIAALFYSGKKDFICNWSGNEEWTSNLSWTGSKFFRAEPLRPWYASPELARAGNETQQAGEYRKYGNLAFAIVDDSGHFVPYDHPVEALAMFNQWTRERKVGFYGKQ